MMRAGKSPRYRRLRPEVDPGAEFSILYCRLGSMGSSRGQGSTSLIKGAQGGRAPDTATTVLRIAHLHDQSTALSAVASEHVQVPTCSRREDETPPGTCINIGAEAQPPREHAA